MQRMAPQTADRQPSDDVLHTFCPLPDAARVNDSARPNDVGPRRDGESAATSVHTWVHLDDPLTVVALDSLSDVTDGPIMSRLITAFADSGHPSLEKKARNLSECCHHWTITCSPTLAGGSPNHCDVRGCPNCNVHRTRRVRKKAEAIFEAERRRGRPIRFITLTIRDVPGEEHGSARRRLLDADRKFRRRRMFKDHVAGAMRKFESIYDKDLDKWHPHFHYLAVGSYWPQAELSEEWVECGGGPVVDIRIAKDAEELLKYTLKHANVPAHKLVEWALDMENVREVEFLGEWRAITPDEEDQEEPTAEELAAFRLVTEDDEAGNEVRVITEARLTWCAWSDECGLPEFARVWARARLREVFLDVKRLVNAADRRAGRAEGRVLGSFSRPDV